MKRSLAVAAAALITAMAAGCSSASPITAHGSLQVFANPLNGETVQNAYPDLTSGAQVTVVNSSGSVIGTGTLTDDPQATAAAAAMMAASIPGTSAGTYMAWVEAFTFTVRVPAGLARYGIRTGQGHGTIWFSPTQMRKGPSLSLGSMS